MTNLARIREWQFEALEKSLRSVDSIVQAADRDGLVRWRDGGSGWTVGEVICHLRDFDAIFSERARLTLGEELPHLPFPNPDALAAEHHYAAEPPAVALASWRTARHAYLALHRALVDEQQWERVGIHPRRGHMTLTDQFMLTLTHDVNHLEQIARIIAEQKG